MTYRMLQMTKQNKPFTLDDVYDLLGKFACILNDEADRIMHISPDKRTSADIKTAISCTSSLVAIQKDLRIEKESITQELRLVPKEKLKGIVGQANQLG